MGRTIKRPDESSFNQLYRDYIFAAKKRNIKFTLSKSQFRKLTKQPCYLCGSPPINIRKVKSGRASYFYSGIDRLNNDRGYVTGNVVACCARCNSIKSKSGLNELISHLIKIVKHISLKGIKEFTNE